MLISKINILDHVAIYTSRKNIGNEKNGVGMAKQGRNVNDVFAM